MRADEGQRPKSKRGIGPKCFPSGVAINFGCSARLAGKKVIVTWAFKDMF